MVQARGSTPYPLKSMQDLTLNRQQFRNSLRLHYNLQLADLPSHCACGDRFTVSHALSCKKTGFVAQRHDGIQNLRTPLLSKICKDVEVEPHLLSIDHEVFKIHHHKSVLRLDWT